MAAKNKFMNAMKMPAIADMFSSEADRQRESGDLVTEVPLSELHPFVNHPFEVRDDEDMQKLVDSIKENGVLTNLTVRPRAEGGYEIISGHRRFHAAQLAGLDKIKVQVRDVDDDQAIIDMVDANIQREHISPMEKARALALINALSVGEGLFIGNFHQQLCDCLLKVLFRRDTAVAGQIALRVKIHHEYAVALLGKKLVEVIGVDRVRPHTYTQRDGYTWVQVEKDMHITEWLYAHELCSSLQFTRFLNRDGRELFQVRDGQRVIETNADGTKRIRAVKSIDVTHAYVGHYGCHIQQYAEDNFRIGCYVAPEHPQQGDLLYRRCCNRLHGCGFWNRHNS